MSQARRRHAGDHHDVVAPVELVGLARRKRQRHEGRGARRRMVPGPRPRVTPDRVVAALVALCPQLLEHPDQGQPLACRHGRIGAQHPLEFARPSRR